MARLATLALICATALIAACSHKAPNLNGQYGDGAGGAGAYGAGMAGSASDPTSPAYFQQTIGDRVHFLVDQYTLTPEAQGILAQQAQWLAKNPSYQATIEGHADEQGTREYNLALGARRASSVYDFLINHGVSASRLKTISYGKERPIALCSDESCYAQNRRAVTVLRAAGLGQ